MQGQTDRRITLRQAIVYVDQGGHHIFVHDTLGVILKLPVGNPEFSSFDQVVSIDPGGKSLAQVHEIQGYSIEGELPLWNQLSKWIKNKR